MEITNFYHLKGPTIWEPGGLPGTYEQQLRELCRLRSRTIERAHFAQSIHRPSIVSNNCRLLGFLQERIDVLELAIKVREVEEGASRPGQ